MWIISYKTVFAQSGDAPSGVDTFSSNAGSAAGANLVPDSMPGAGLLQGPISIPVVIPSLRSDSDAKWTKVVDDIERFCVSLPNDRHTLLAKLKDLIQESVDQWDEDWDPWKGARWEGYCQAILRKLPNDKCECAWNDVYYLAATEYWRGDPEKKKEILAKWAEAEKICGSADIPAEKPIPPTVSSSMPPLAPPRVKQPQVRSVAITGSDIAQRALDLGTNYPQRWQTDERRHIYKCNWFVDAALRESGVKLPWKANAIPNIHGMLIQLSQYSKQFTKIWPNSNLKFSEPLVRAGDIVFWDKDFKGTNLQHGAILDGLGNMLYAGSIDTGGFALSKLSEFIKSIYGPPTVVFRYKNTKN